MILVSRLAYACMSSAIHNTNQSGGWLVQFSATHAFSLSVHTNDEPPDALPFTASCRVCCTRLTGSVPPCAP